MRTVIRVSDFALVLVLYTKSFTQKSPAKFAAYLFGVDCTRPMRVAVPAPSRSSVRTSYGLADLHIAWWFRSDALQTQNMTLRVRDFVPARDCTASQRNISFHVYSFKQVPQPSLQRNYLVDGLLNGVDTFLNGRGCQHFGRILVLKLDEENCVHSMRRSDYRLVQRVVLGCVCGLSSRRRYANNYIALFV